jgi:hypothetical protein
MPSDLEDDVLMQLIDTAKELDQVKTRTAKQIAHLKLRADLIENVWKELDRLTKAMVRNPETVMLYERELRALKEAVVAVLTFDEQTKK